LAASESLPFPDKKIRKHFPKISSFNGDKKSNITSKFTKMLEISK